METRKLISFGNSSFIVSLPKPWVYKHSLEKGDFIYCSENGNDELILSPQQKETKKEALSIVLNVSKKSIKDLKREFLSYYIAGYDIIKITSQQPMIFQNELRDIIRDFTTMDIAEQDANSIVVKDFLNIEKISLEDLTRRMDLVIRSMIEDSKNIRTARSNVEKIYNMDKEVNRITFMLFRFIKKALNDTSLSRIFGLKSNDLLSLWLLISNLERIADEVKRISKFCRMLKISKEDMARLMKVYISLEKEYISVMKAYYSKNKDMALSIAANKDKIIDLCNSFKSNDPVAGSLIEKMKGMEVCIVYIARVVYE